MKIKKSLIISASILVGGIVASLLAFVPMNRMHSSYSKTWMSHVDDNTKIKELSLPGTHNSGALHSFLDVAGKCQDIDVETQLNIGVRFFDIRIQLIKNEFVIMHSFVEQNLTFIEVLDDFSSFLRTNKEEFLLLSIKEEEDPVDSTISYADALKRDLEDYKDIISFDTSLPETLKDARGKAYIISRTNCDFGIPVYSNWENDTTFSFDNFYIQDNYDVAEIEEKKTDILSTIEYSNNNSDKLVLNFTSCNFDPGFPPNYAGAPALLINPWLTKIIKENTGRLGVVVMDFVDEELSKTIYMRNI